MIPQRSKKHQKTRTEVVSIKKAKQYEGVLPKALLTFFTLLFLCSMLLFIYSYRSLNRSIQDERINSVQQLGELISDKVSMLRDDYAKEATRFAALLKNSGVSDSKTLRTLFPDGDILLVTDTGMMLSLDGSRWLVDDRELRRNVMEGTGVMSTFSTIQTRGDYWLFSVGVRDVVVDDVPVVGLVQMVDAAEYAKVATIPLYGGLGASYVVDAQGAILIRPQAAEANSVFNGYNMFRILKQEQVAQEEIDRLREAIRDEKEYQFVADIQATTWLIQSIPGDSGRGIVITVPVSVTARDTYSGMRNVVILIAMMVLSLGALVLGSLILIIKKNQAVELSQAKTRAKNDFLDKMSHDIRTPLNAIVGMLELAMGSVDSREMLLDCLKKAKVSSEYLVSIINDVLDMSKIERGKMTIAHRQFSMTELLDHIVQMETIPAGDKGLDFSLEVKTPVDTDYMGDPVRLRQCLVNLISNAIKFTAKGGQVELIYESLPMDDGHELARFTVRDTGIGMSEEFLGRMFNPFEQEYSSRTSTYVGSGLGLSIVKNLAELMGGTVDVTSSLGQGSTFTLSIPLETAEKMVAASIEKPDEGLLGLLKGRRVLLVEDNEINREIGELILKRLGLLVDMAVNGQEAVEKMGHAPKDYYSIILMDIQMPVMNGLEAAKRIRALDHPDGRDIPIIALSANAFDEDSRRSMEAGMQAHLAKPIDMVELKKVLKKYIMSGD